MRRLLLLGVVFGLGVAAEAAPKRKVKIESDPPGATVYLNAKEDGPVCTTPCTIDVPVGDTPIIVELENHKQLFENLIVPSKKPVSVKYKLIPAIGTIVVKGPKGASITVDDIDKGKAPTTFSVPAGPHTVVLTQDGKKIATEFVDVPSNDEIVIEGKATQTASAKKVPDPPEEEEEEETTNTSNNTTGVSSSAVIGPKVERGPYISLAVAMDVGFRNFEYEGEMGDNVAPEKEGGQVLIGPVVELWPGTLAGVRALRGLSLLVRFGYGVNSQQVKQNDMPTTAKTFWRSFEASVRQRFPIKDVAAIEIGGGFVRDQYQFEGEEDDIALVPDADYQSVRIGARISAMAGSIEPYLALENRFVLSGGAIGERFDKASANGFRAAVGAGLKLGAVTARVEGAINYYAWTFENTGVNPTYVADGGTDSIKLITASVGYAY